MTRHDERPTPIVSLEPRTTAHAEALFAVVAAPALYRFIEEAPPASVDALRARLARSASRKSPDGSEHWLNWVVHDEQGTLAGHVQATIAAHGEVNVAYVIGSAFHGRGVATAAVARMIGLVRAGFDARRFVIVAERRNVASVRVAARLGFVEASRAEAVRRGLPDTDVVWTKVFDGVDG